jgi:SsrA-binding protein
MAKGKGKKKDAPKAEPGIKPIARNRRAFHDYEVLEKVEAGLVLQGTEVKSLRAGHVSFGDAHAKLKKGEAWLRDLHITPYEHGSYMNHEANRPRKLLLHKREILKIQQKIERQGLTVIPLELYWKRGYCKVRLGICRGRKRHDKRDALRKKQDQRQMARQVRHGGR